MVRAFFRAVTHRSFTELTSVVDDDALAFRPNQEPTSATVTWRRRLEVFDYSGQEWAQLVPIQIFDRTRAQQLERVRLFRLQPASGEWLAVVELPSVQGPRVWGTELQFILQDRDGELRIRKIWEDFAP